MLRKGLSTVIYYASDTLVVAVSRFDVTKVRLYFELQNYFPKNFSILTLINCYKGSITL